MKAYRTTLAEIKRRGGGSVDRARLRATTGAAIARQIAADPDTAPPLDRLGPPVPSVRTIRARLAMTQEVLARRLKVPVSTIRNWEQGRVRPDPAAIALLTVLDRDPATTLRLLAGSVRGK
ncbi:MAG: helix-turn-helix domain-containing protein [Alphaproteobacteria bacterium]|nr:helix-turn-helix domain-containing protein [Alphaproteobacteria bacterium]